MNNLLFTTVSALAAANPFGFTFDVINQETPVSGYCVALQETQNSFGVDGLQKVLDLVLSGQTRATCVGGWLDQKTGLYYYDATVLVHDRNEAIKLGRINNQIAIFCLDTCEEIYL